MPRPADDVTDTQLAMLQVLWDRGEATRRDVTDTLYPGGGQAHYATVQKLLERLEDRGFVRHVRRNGVLVYTAAVGRDELINRRLRDVADRLCGGAVAPLVMTLVKSKPLSPAELRELTEFLEGQKRRARRSQR
jgi:BlaI family transcriptional regulator, penicillinase repressor